MNKIFISYKIQKFLYLVINKYKYFVSLKKLFIVLIK